MSQRPRLLLVSFLSAFLFSITAATAADLTRLGPSVYDSGLGITLLQDANFSATNAFPQSAGANGFMFLRDAHRLVTELNARRYLGVDRWRLPTLEELQHLSAVDGVRWVFRDAGAAYPFVNLGSYYWTQDGRSFSFINGNEVNFASYRYVLPVFDGRGPQLKQLSPIPRFRIDPRRQIPRLPPSAPRIPVPIPWLGGTRAPACGDGVLHQDRGESCDCGLDRNGNMNRDCVQVYEDGSHADRPMSHDASFCKNGCRIDYL